MRTNAFSQSNWVGGASLGSGLPDNVELSVSVGAAAATASSGSDEIDDGSAGGSTLEGAVKYTKSPPYWSVVDEQLRVRGIAGLTVAGTK